MGERLIRLSVCLSACCVLTTHGRVGARLVGASGRSPHTLLPFLCSTEEEHPSGWAGREDDDQKQQPALPAPGMTLRAAIYLRVALGLPQGKLPALESDSTQVAGQCCRTTQPQQGGRLSRNLGVSCRDSRGTARGAQGGLKTPH